MDINRLLNGFLGSDAGASVANTASQAGSAAKGALSGLPGGLAGGAAAGGIAALLLGTKKGRKYGGAALKYGGMAALGGLAYKAYSNYKTNQSQAPSSTAPQNRPDPSTVPPAPAPVESGFDPAQITDARGQDMRLSLMQAMISAAKADGHIDAAENKVIMDQIDQMGLAADEKSFLFDQLRAPSDPIAIANLASDEPQAAELYLASLLTIDTDTPEEERYMERLGDALRLPVALRSELVAHASSVKT
ncbi:MAG: tellurite resistance TerB family protein [Alphaproteobacteria bacterium]|nr:tellurite resistance TerB family protein [Alphaproteobacteria bacterium]